MAYQPRIDWVVAVHSGPSSPDNLLTTMVAWARWRGFDPRSFSLWFEDGGRFLVLRGFDVQLLSDFLSYARSQSIPPLVCGPASQRLLSPPAETPKEPEPAPTSAPPLPPTDSSPLMQGVLQILTERETEVYAVENRLMDVFGTTDIKESSVLWAALLAGKKNVDPTLLALATTPSLREEGCKLFGVPENELVKKFFPAGPAANKEIAIPEDASADLRLRFDAYKRALDGVKSYWEGVLFRLNKPSTQEGRMSAAVLIEGSDGKVTWVFPRATSPVVRALSSCVLHAYGAPGGVQTSSRQRAIAGVAFASKLASLVRVSLRWYVITSGKIEQVVSAVERLESSELTILSGLLGRYGGLVLIVEPPPQKKPEPVPPKKMEAPVPKPEEAVVRKKVTKVATPEVPPPKKEVKPPRRKTTKPKK